jgi:hypothetical protein
MQHGEYLKGAFVSRVMASVAVAGLVVLSAACGSTPSSEEEPEATAAVADDHADHEGGAGRVFFVQPTDGATVESPVQFEFGSEDFMISAVPEVVENVREGMGHHHLGVENDCLPGGEEIPKGTPGWVHFGTGNNSIEMQLTPGVHKFSLQVGDDQHRTLAGLCETISITVE